MEALVKEELLQKFKNIQLYYILPLVIFITSFTFEYYGYTFYILPIIILFWFICNLFFNDLSLANLTLLTIINMLFSSLIIQATSPEENCCFKTEKNAFVGFKIFFEIIQNKKQKENYIIFIQSILLSILSIAMQLTTRLNGSLRYYVFGFIIIFSLVLAILFDFQLLASLMMYLAAIDTY